MDMRLPSRGTDFSLGNLRRMTIGLAPGWICAISILCDFLDESSARLGTTCWPRLWRTLCARRHGTKAQS